MSVRAPGVFILYLNVLLLVHMHVCMGISSLALLFLSKASLLLAGLLPAGLISLTKIAVGKEAMDPPPTRAYWRQPRPTCQCSESGEALDSYMTILMNIWHPPSLSCRSSFSGPEAPALGLH